jgi:hypothetical protein
LVVVGKNHYSHTGGATNVRAMMPDQCARSRLYAARAHRYPTSAMPMHQATARMALLPMGVPISSPRSVSMTGVKGWYSAN